MPSALDHWNFSAIVCRPLRASQIIGMQTHLSACLLLQVCFEKEAKSISLLKMHVYNSAVAFWNVLTILIINWLNSRINIFNHTSCCRIGHNKLLIIGYHYWPRNSISLHPSCLNILDFCVCFPPYSDVIKQEDWSVCYKESICLYSGFELGL